ncbi:MAG: Phosphomannomutase [Parcubacteria group bacterium Gr01-1014_66]|nr:MAG: Phosphomannomutase [Parcubacteria group bacterium Gr01-1014_66]
MAAHANAANESEDFDLFASFVFICRFASLLMKINPTLFREYDIRGRIDRKDEFTDYAIDTISRAFATYLGRRGIHDAVVAQDARPYSLRVKEIVVRALCESGINVTEIDTVLVPIFYFSQYALKKKGGVMVTASHNPWGWSGFKHAYDYSTTFVPEDMRELREIVEKEDFMKGSGTHEAYPGIIEEYKKDVIGRVKLERHMTVLMDAGNGTAGAIVPDILRAAGCTVIEQYTTPSETRHHEANPSSAGMLDAMREGVRTHPVDIGLGFDDDGDRLGAVDEEGGIIWPDRILILLARAVLAKKPGGKIVFDVKSTDALTEDIKAHGGVPVMWKTGHSYIKQKAKEVDAVLAGERSGHIFFRDGYYGFDDATFAALKLLEYVSRDPKPVSEIIAALPRYITSPVWHASCDDTKKYAVVERLTKQLTQEFGEEKVIDINGARVKFDDGWGLVRASSNVPALVLVFEARTEEGLKYIEHFFRAQLQQFPEVGQEWESG